MSLKLEIFYGWLLAILTALGILLVSECAVAKPAHAGSFYLDVGVGTTLFQRTTEDGTWIQDGLPNQTDFTSFAYRAGLGYTFNERWSIQASYLNLGIARIRARVVHDPDYDPKGSVCLASCGNAFPFNTTDRMYGGELSITRTFTDWPVRPFIKAGAALMYHHLKADVQVLYPSPGNFSIDSKGYIPMGLVGLGACYKAICAESTWYQGIGGSNGLPGMEYGLPIANSTLVTMASVKIPLAW